MSAGSPSGAVQMSAELDLRQAYAALNQFRKDASNVTIGGTFGATAGVPGASSAFTAASAAFEGGAQRFMTPPGTPATFQAIAGGNFSGPAFTSAAASQMPMMQFGQQLQQLTQAVQQMTAAASRMGSFAAAGGGTGAAAAVAEEEAGVGPASPGRRRFPSFRSARGGIFSTARFAGGGWGVGAVAVGAMFLQAEEQRESNIHELMVAHQIGQAPGERIRMEFAQMERARQGMGLVTQNAAEWLANKTGINPGGILTVASDRERQYTGAMRDLNSADFDRQSRMSYFGSRMSAFENLERNPNVQERMRIQREETERNIGIMDRFGTEQLKFDKGSTRWNELQTQQENAIRASSDLRWSQDIAQADKEQWQTRRHVAQAERFGLLNQRRGLDSEMAVLKEEWQEAEKNAPPSDRGKVLMEFTQRAEFAKLQQADRTNILQATIGARNRALSIAGLTHPENPALAGALGDVSSTYTGALLNAYETSRRSDLDPTKKAGIERGQLYTGVLELQVQRQNFKRSLRGDELDSINQSALQGPGTVAAGDYLSQISEAVENLNKITAMLSTLTPAVQDLIDNSD